MFVSLFVPAGDERKLASAARQPIAEAIVDLEDAIAPYRKVQARAALPASLAPFAGTPIAVRVRINAISTNLWEDDVRAAIAAGAKRLLVPKIETREQLQRLDALLDHLDRERTVTYGGIIETAEGMVALDDLIVALPRLRHVSLGFADLSADLGIRWRDVIATEPPLFTGLRERSVLLHRARGLEPPWDSVWLAIDDLDGLRRDATLGARLGFAGKSAIHPKHIAIINEVYAPDPAEIARARRIVEAYERAQAEGTGAIALDGMMIDVPVLLEAQRYLARVAPEPPAGG